jgi:hypothetical protein
MLIPQASPTPRLLLRNSSPMVIAEAAAGIAVVAAEDNSFQALGYRQTVKPAAQGGKANANGFRFRNGGIRALARTFRGKPFLTAHDRGDVRARGGTINDAFASEMPGDLEMAIYFDITAQSAWAIEGLKNGTIDRFSFGVMPSGEAMCTVHGVPVWSTDECWCWPGETVLDSKGAEVTAEWEHEAGVGMELSAVNVPAVDGTGIVDNRADRPSLQFVEGRELELAALSKLCGRTKPWAERDAARVSAAVPGVFARADAPVTLCATPAFAKDDRVECLVNHMPKMKGMRGAVKIANEGTPPYYGVRFDDQDAMPGTHKWLAENEIKAEPQEGGSPAKMTASTMASDETRMPMKDRELFCKSLGLPVTATDEELFARGNTLSNEAAQAGVLKAQLADEAKRAQTLSDERDAAHVDTELVRLKATRTVSDEVVASLRTAAKTSRTSFDSSLALVERSAPVLNAAPPIGSAPVLQSNGAEAATPGVLTFGADGPDAFESNRTNANMPILMKSCGVSPDDIRKYGARKFSVEPKLRDLINNTAARGDRFGV